MTPTPKISDRLLQKYGEPCFVESTTEPEDIKHCDEWFRESIQRVRAQGAQHTESVMSLDGHTLTLYGWKHKAKDDWKSSTPK